MDARDIDRADIDRLAAASGELRGYVSRRIKLDGVVFVNGASVKVSATSSGRHLKISPVQPSTH